MKKLTFVLALVVVFGVFASMFVVGVSSEPTRYNVKQISRGFTDSQWASYGVLSSLTAPGNGMKIEITSDDIKASALGSLSGISGFLLDFGEMYKINALCYSDCTKSAESHASGKVATYWYSADGVNFTQLSDITLEIVGNSYQYRSEARTELEKYATPFRVIFPEVDARYLMIGVESAANGSFTLAYLKDTANYANGNVYALYDENENFDTQEKDYGYVDCWGGDYTFGVAGSDKTVETQRAEILAAMNRAIETDTVWKEVPSYNPTISAYAHIKAITYEAFEYQGHKTKVFAYVGFPEGASSENPVPAVVLVHGGGGHAYMEWVRLWNERGYAAIAMETTGAFPTAPNGGVTEADGTTYVQGPHGVFVEEGFGSAPSRSYPTSYAEVDEHWAYHGLTQVILAGNILRQDDRVITDQIGITGISWGGIMVSQIIGYDQRYAFAIPTYGTAYLGDPVRVFENWDEPYIQALWAAERLLDNATMPILWYTYADDSAFGIPSYNKSYLHTEGLNDKNTFVMLRQWGHSHRHVFQKIDTCLNYADWIVKGKGGFITVLEQPTGRDITCKLNLPEGTTDIRVTVNYITDRMTYRTFDKFGWGYNSKFLAQYWQYYEAEATVDANGVLKAGKIPANAAGYYLSMNYKVNGIAYESSSVYVDCSKIKHTYDIDIYEYDDQNTDKIYIRLNSQLSTDLFLVLNKETRRDSIAYTYTLGETTYDMFWSAKYNAYCVLVPATSAAEAVAGTIAFKDGTATEVDYAGDVNMANTDSEVIDANDAQLVYNIYNSVYTDFTDEVSMENFLRADVNGDGVITIADAVAIVTEILK